jgi:hypothetical protein
VIILILPTSAIEEIFINYFFAIVAPKCKENQRIIYGAAFKSDVMVTCRVEANPMPHSFRWQFKTASKRRRTDLINTVGGAKALDNIKDMVDLPANQFTLEYDHSLLRYFEKKNHYTGRVVNILYVPPIPQQIQISVDQPYAGPAASCCVISGTHRV